MNRLQIPHSLQNIHFLYLICESVPVILLGSTYVFLRRLLLRFADCRMPKENYLVFFPMCRRKALPGLRQLHLCKCCRPDISTRKVVGRIFRRLRSLCQCRQICPFRNVNLIMPCLSQLNHLFFPTLPRFSGHILPCLADCHGRPNIVF